MRIETTYYAFDDEEFCTEEECLEYENRIKQSFDGAVFFDENAKRLTIAAPDEINDAYAEAFYIKIVDAKKANTLFRYIESYSGFEIDANEYSAGDILAFDADYDKWINFKKVIEDMQKKVGLIDGT